MPFRFLLTAAALCLTISASAEDIALPGLCGKLANGIYTAPGNQYKVPIPVLTELGGQVHDTENVVTFDDEINTHVSIACFPLDQAQKWELDTRGLRSYLAYFYVGFVFADFGQRYPGASTESTYFVPDLLDGSLLAITLLPGGSFFDKTARELAGPNMPPPVAKRGNFLFVRQDYIYVVSAELAERVSQGKAFGKTAEEENIILRDRLVSFIHRIEFIAPAASRKP